MSFTGYEIYGDINDNSKFWTDHFNPMTYLANDWYIIRSHNGKYEKKYKTLDEIYDKDKLFGDYFKYPDQREELKKEYGGYVIEIEYDPEQEKLFQCASFIEHEFFLKEDKFKTVNMPEVLDKD